MSDEPGFGILDRAAFVASLDLYQAGWRDTWFYRYLRRIPRAHWARTENVVFVLRGNEQNSRLLAHEYGHYLGHKHPAMRSLAYWLDVMGYGLRLLDEHGLLEASRRWRERQ